MTRTILASLALCALPFSLKASSGLDAIVEKILSNNHELVAATVQNQATLQQMKTENNLPPTEVSFSHEWGHRGVGNKTGVEISQGFDWPGAYGARNESRRATASALDLLLLQRRSELTLEIKQQLITLWAAAKKKKLYAQAVSKIDSLSAIVAREVERHEVSVLDGNRLKIERISLARKLAASIDTYHQAYGALTQLNGGAAIDEAFAVADGLEPEAKLQPLEYYYEQANSQNFETAYRQKLADASKAEAKALRLSSYPGFSLGLTHENEMGDRFTGFSFGVTFPFFSNKGRVKASQLATQAVEAESTVLESATRARIHTEYVRAEQLADEVAQYSAIIESADHQRLLDKAFDSRHISLADYISDLIYFTEATGDFVDLNMEYYLLVASLDRYTMPTFCERGSKSPFDKEC